MVSERLFFYLLFFFRGGIGGCFHHIYLFLKGSKVMDNSSLAPDDVPRDISSPCVDPSVFIFSDAIKQAMARFLLCCFSEVKKVEGAYTDLSVATIVASGHSGCYSSPIAE